MKLTTATIALFGITLLSACGDDDNDDAGVRRDGSTNTDGGVNNDAATGDAGVDTSCSASALSAPGCGNSPVGNWTYKSACGVISSATLTALCPQIEIQATSHQVTGTLQITATNYTLDTTDVANIMARVPAICAAQAGGCDNVATALRAQFTAASCTQDNTGCDCDVTATISVAENGTYTTAGGVLTTVPTTGTGAAYNYCVEGGAFRYRAQGDTIVYVTAP
jgi:hypothetical protein